MDNHIQDATGFSSLYSDICSIIEEAREQAYRAVNVSLTLRNWMLGERIAREKLDGEERAEYGKQVITTLAKELTHAYGKGLNVFLCIIITRVRDKKIFRKVPIALISLCVPVGLPAYCQRNNRL